MHSWTRYLFRRQEILKTTWLLRIAVVALLSLLFAATRDHWIRAMAQSLMCSEESVPSAQAVMIENFETEYPLFEEAARLQRRLGARILIPLPASAEDGEPNLVSARIVEVLTKLAGIQDVTSIAVHEREPIVLTTAYQVRSFLEKHGMRSLAVVVPAFRSRRAALVYKRVFGESGITVACVPVLRDTTPYAWPETLHGVQQVTEQFIKLQYYRFYVLPFVAGRHGTGEPAGS